jgi:hypothetical protein
MASQRWWLHGVAQTLQRWWSHKGCNHGGFVEMGVLVLVDSLLH